MIVRCLSLATLSLVAASCAQNPGAEPAPEKTAAVTMVARTSAAAHTQAVPIAIDPAITGLWQPYDDESHTTLGTMDLQSDRIVFGKGLTLRFAALSPGLVRIEHGDGARPVSGPDTLCGADPVLSVSFVLKETLGRKVLRVSVHDVPTGPGPDPDFDLHRCQTFTYVRD